MMISDRRELRRKVSWGATVLFVVLPLLVSVPPVQARVALDVTGAQFVDGGFDDGPGAAWVESSSHDLGIILTELGQGATARSKPYAAWLGGYDFEQASVEQTVTVTPPTPVLRYWRWVDSDEGSCIFDVARVFAGGKEVSRLGLCSSANTGGWVERTVDLSVFEGLTLPVRFQVNTDCCTVSSEYIEDVALIASPLARLAASAGKNGALVRLTWAHSAPYTGYEVWRSTSPYFLIGEPGSVKRADIPPPAGVQAAYEDAGATGDTSANYFYLVRGAGAGTTRTSNRTGEFEFELVRGQ